MLLPDGFRGLMVAAMLAGITATETFMVVGSAIFTRNFYEHIVRNKRPEHYLMVGRIAAMGMLIAGVVVAFLSPSLTAILKISIEIIAFMGPAFWIGIAWRRANSYGAWAGVIAGITAWLITARLGWDAPQRIALVVPLQFVLTIIVSYFTPPMPKEQLEPFYAKLHTSVAEEETGEKITTPRKLINHPDIELPRLNLVDIAGFIVAWGLVAVLIGLLWWLSRIGAL